jgi:hypothetical protein
MFNNDWASGPPDPNDPDDPRNNPNYAMGQGIVGAAQGMSQEPGQSLGQTLNAGLAGFAGAYGAARRPDQPSPLQGLLDRIRGTGAHTAAGAMPSPMAQQGPMQSPQPGAMGGMLGGPQPAQPGGMTPEMLQQLMQMRGMGIG